MSNEIKSAIRVTLAAVKAELATGKTSPELQQLTQKAIEAAGTPSADTEEAFKMKVVTICKWGTPAARRHSNKQKQLDDFLSSPEALVLVAIGFFFFYTF